MSDAEPGRPRWLTDMAPGHSADYVRRFRAMAEQGQDLTGEARLVDALVAPGSLILDAGCGPGRVGAYLHGRGHGVIGVDVDPVLIAAAVEDHPGPTWLLGDLLTVPLPDGDGPDGLDAVVLAGNVMVFLAPGSEYRVLARLAAALRPGGVLVAGFATDREYTVADLDRDAATAGLVHEHRFAGWDLAPWRADSAWAVTVLRRT